MSHYLLFLPPIYNIRGTCCIWVSLSLSYPPGLAGDLMASTILLSSFVSIKQSRLLLTQEPHPKRPNINNTKMSTLTDDVIYMVGTQNERKHVRPCAKCISTNINKTPSEHDRRTFFINCHVLSHRPYKLWIMLRIDSHCTAQKKTGLKFIDCNWVAQLHSIPFVLTTLLPLNCSGLIWGFFNVIMHITEELPSIYIAVLGLY